MRLVQYLVATPLTGAALLVLVAGPADFAPGLFGALVGLYLVVTWLVMADTERAFWPAVGGAVVVLMAYMSLLPAHGRDWLPEHARLPSVQVQGDELIVDQLRTFRWSADGVDEDWTRRSYDLGRLQGMDLVVSHFDEFEGIAHTLLSFRFSNGDVLAVSPEIRKEVGEEYSPLRGLFRNYELIYVLADERDVLHVRTHVRSEQVYVFPVDVQPSTARNVLEEIIARAQSIERSPEWYNTATASCATTLAADLQAVADPPLDLDWRVLVPGFSGALAHELGFLGDGDFEALKTAAFADPARWEGQGDYSRAIRNR